MENTRTSQSILVASLVVLVLGILASIWLWSVLDQQEDARLGREIQLQQERVRAEIEAGMNSRVLGLTRMADRWEATRGTPYTQWLSDSDNYRKDEPGYYAISWVDAESIVRWISAGFDASEFIGLDMNFEESRHNAMFSARTLVQPTFTQAIDLVTGQKGIDVFVPIHLHPDDQFDGYILAVYQIDEILDTLIRLRPDVNAYVIDGGTQIYAQKKNESLPKEELSAKSTMSIYNLAWELKLVPTQDWLNNHRDSQPEVFLVAGSFASLLLAMFLYASLSSISNARALQSSQQRLSATFEALPDLVFILDGKLTYREVLSADPSVLKVEASKLPGKTMYEVLPEKGARLVQEAVEACLNGEEAKRVEYYVTTPRGKVWFEGRAAKLYTNDPKSNLVVWIARDVTERVNNRAELARSNAELEQFAYLASHDLQEPLRKIITFSDRLTRHLPETTDNKANDYLDRMRSAAQRMRTLINDLLTFSRLSAETPPFSIVNLNTVVKNVLDDLSPAIESASAEVKSNKLPEVHGDPDQLRSLMQNLIGNAIKYRRPDVPAVISVYAKTKANQIEIVVEDNGLGFNKKYADQIFLPFKRLHSRSEIPGSGIGLAICQKIVQNHRGTLKATSQEGEGSKFRITLPRS